MSFDYNTRVRTGIVALMALALLSNVRLLLEYIEFDMSFVGRDGVSKFEKKFEGVKAKLPPNGIIGFRTDHPEDLAQYYMTQYTLAPVVVAKLPGQKYVISLKRDDLNWSDENSGRDFTVSSPGRDFKTFDYHNGIKLIRLDDGFNGDPFEDEDELKSDVK